MPRLSLIPALLVLALFVADTHAQVPQTLVATIGDEKFVSDDSNINLVPAAGSFTLMAATAGADAYPPPKTPIDRLSIICNGYADGKATTYASKEWGPDLCQVNFIKGDKPMGGEPDATYKLDKSASDNLLEITSATGKVIEGRFHFTLKGEKGEKMRVSDGSFKAEDRQL